jgi:hypothetical protein
MTRLGAFAVSSMCLLALGPAGALARRHQPSPSPSPTLPACPSLRAEMTLDVDSATAHVGDVFTFRTMDTVVMPHGPTVAAGTPGYGLVMAVVPAGAHGKAGLLSLEARYLVLARRRRYDVTIDTGALSQTGATNAISGVFSALPVPGIGLATNAVNYLRAGKNVHVPSGTRFFVVPVGDLSRGSPRCAR